jgi:flagellar basal body-associated protein FliL
MNQPSGDLNNLVFRARELKRLGNSDAEIHAVLLRLGAGPQDAEAILAQIRPAGKKSGGSCLLWLALGLVVAVIAGGVLAARYLFTPAAPPQQAGAAEAADPLNFLYELVIPTPYARAASPAPTKAAALPPAAAAYFAVVWNLEGSPMEKAGKLAAAVPPAELMIPHAELAMNYAVFANAEQQLKAMEAMIELECAGDTSDYCKDLQSEMAKFKIDRDKAQSEMNDRWLRACETWRDYYKRAGVPFPYAEGRCKYP